MSLTLIELKTEIEVDKIYKKLTLQDWKAKSDYRGITKRSQKDFDNLVPMYVEKIGGIRERLRGDWSVTLTPIVGDKLKTPLEMGNELMEELQYLLDKETRLIDKFATCLKEVEMRKDGDVVRIGLHDQANYYVDYANGTDGAGTVHDGLAEPAEAVEDSNYYTMVNVNATNVTEESVVIAIDDLDNGIDDDYNGDYLYNVTVGEGKIISGYDYDNGDGASVITVPTITGQVATDEFYILRSLKKMDEVCSRLVRTAGDVIHLRANTTWLQGTDAEDIAFDENGTDDDYIKIIGCGRVGDGDADPWVDDDATVPIIDFENAAYELRLTDDKYWWFERLHLKQSGDALGNVYVSAGVGIYFKSCEFSDTLSGTVEGLNVTVSYVTVDSCTFINNGEYSIFVASGIVHVKNSTFNSGGDVGTDNGIAVQGGTVYVEDSTFGVTTAHGTTDIWVIRGGQVYTRNCIWTKIPYISDNASGFIYSEDDDATFETQIFTTGGGIITRNTTGGNLHGGGADSVAKMAPSSVCGPNNPLTLGGNPLSKDFKIWLSAAEHTVTIYANRVDSDWATEPVAANFYIQASYLSNGVTAARSLSTPSTQDIADSDTWTGFTTTFTMAREGWAYIRLSLEKYESGKFVYVDIKPD